MTEAGEQKEELLEWAICREPQRTQLNRLGTEWIQGNLPARDVALALWKLRVECVMHREAHVEPQIRKKRRWSDSENSDVATRRWGDVDLDIQALAEALIEQGSRLSLTNAEERCIILEDKCEFVRDKANKVDRAL